MQGMRSRQAETNHYRLQRTCVKCKEVITRGVLYREETWHADCFKCGSCELPLAKEKFLSREDVPYCKECFGELFEEKCSSCSKPITGLGDFLLIYFDRRHWHPSCFLCDCCESSLVGQLVVRSGVEILCTECASSSSSS